MRCTNKLRPVLVSFRERFVYRSSCAKPLEPKNSFYSIKEARRKVRLLLLGFIVFKFTGNLLCLIILRIEMVFMYVVPFVEQQSEVFSMDHALELVQEILGDLEDVRKGRWSEKETELAVYFLDDGASRRWRSFELRVPACCSPTERAKPPWIRHM